RRHRASAVEVRCFAARSRVTMSPFAAALGIRGRAPAPRAHGSDNDEPREPHAGSLAEPPASVTPPPRSRRERRRQITSATIAHYVKRGVWGRCRGDAPPQVRRAELPHEDDEQARGDLETEDDQCVELQRLLRRAGALDRRAEDDADAERDVTRAD